MDTKEYWLKMGKIEQQEGFVPAGVYLEQMRILFGELDKLEFESVIEFGCGFGRTARMLLERYPGIKKYTGFDISAEQLHQASKYCREFDKLSLFQTDLVEDCISEFDRADLVIAFEVLMHIAPEDVPGVMKNMISSSLKYVVSVDYTGTSKGLVWYNWSHPYADIYQKKSIRVPIELTKQSIFIVTL